MVPVVDGACHGDPRCEERRNEAHEKLQRFAATTQDRFATVFAVQTGATKQVELLYSSNDDDD